MATSLIGTLTDLQAANIALDALFVSVCTQPLDMSNALLENDFEWIKTAADVNATDTTAEFCLAWMPRRAKLVSITYTPIAAGLTASATVYASILVNWRAGTTTGGASGALGALVTTLATSGGTGTWTQWVPVVATAAGEPAPWGTPSVYINAFDPVNNCVPQGGIITVNIAKASTGTAVPAGTLQVRVRYV